jgi:putative ABC transport system ATP-binding protein
MEKILTVDNLSKQFKTGENIVQALKNINLKVTKNETVSILGPSGSGKTIFLGLLAGLEKPSSGEIIILNKNINKMNEEKLTEFRGKYIGYVFQSFRLLPNLTALENIRVGLEMVNQKDSYGIALEWLEKIGLSERKNHYPLQMSGGEQQRIALARALAKKPKLLLADEPTGNLDNKTGYKMMDMLFELCEEHKISLIMVTHDSKLAEKTSRVIQIRDGELIK